MALTIRPAVADDAALILHFITELAIYEKAEDQVAATTQSIVASLFGAESPSKALICELDGKAIGYAVYFFSYSTWQAKAGLYLEDLYVSPDARGLGAGKRLLQHLAAIAWEKGCGRFEWSVLDWNEPAIQFYESLGAKAQSEWIRYRVEGDAIREMAFAPTPVQSTSAITQ
ncbi:GNAT family N-acetyltransferase [Paraburkholderia sp. Ac-20340]|uniref:GNAT family N-acetyltransferase n=1 Tax=Paraburkholderia sp. Ac-20340 TaxID=2703888 RepID=UPI00197D6A0D|nr:GNAT family N-acetyltransferase [Paraburkholderia sp. Ac-20340]MBN3856417.1 GNAT family N-acetyltransferase [Paraburkholderia sp. Ac-20340]